MERGTSHEVEDDSVGGGTQKQQVWSWGAGTEGQLGTEKLQDEHTPQLLSSLSSFGTISFLSCGGAHVIALARDGKVVTWGRGTSGQLGHGDLLNRSQPKIVEALEAFIITNVSAGWNHSGFVSEAGSLFTCGDGLFGQLGHGDHNTQSLPKLVSCLNSGHVCQTACGMRHSLALVQDQSGNKVYSFGSGKRGPLGVSSDEKVRSISLPQICLGLSNVRIVSIYANGDHSAALSDDGQLYTWGRGFGGSRDIHIPHLAPNLRFRQVAIGWNHALLLTENGDVLMLGSYGNGILKSPTTKAQLVHSSFEEKEALQNIHELSGIKVVQIAAGAEHSALVADDGSIMTWGWGEHGQLGHGDTLDHASPKVVGFCSRKCGNNQHISTRVFCGSGFTFCCKDSTCGLNSTTH